MKGKILILVLFILALPYLFLALWRLLPKRKPDYSFLSRIMINPIHDLEDNRARKYFWLDGRDWEFRLEKEKSFNRNMIVPLCWNSIPNLEDYVGKAFYRKRFTLPKEFKAKEKKFFLHFRGVSYRADVFLNSKKIASHEGAYTPFEVELTDALNITGENILEIVVDNRLSQKSIPGQYIGWKHIGGIHRELYLEAREKIYLSDILIKAYPLNNKKGTLVFQAKLNKPKEESLRVRVELIISDEKFTILSQTIESSAGRTEQVLKVSGEIEGVKAWSPSEPVLYPLAVKLFDEEGKLLDELSFDIGFRKIELGGNKLYLNGKPFKIRGISRHNFYPGYYQTLSSSILEEDIRLIKELGANTIRFAHYPAHPYLLKLCDRYGLLVFEEIPAWGNLSPDYSDEQVIALAENELKEMLIRDRNHPSLAFVGIGNQIPSHKHKSLNYIKKLSQLSKELAPSQLTILATKNFEKDLSAEFLDIIGFNCYLGWYTGKPEDLSLKLKKIKSAFPKKPFIISEYGAGAIYGFHGASMDIYTEENQAGTLTKLFKIIEKDDECLGGIIWLFADYPDPIRVFEPEPFYNLKGLVDENRNPKLAFSVVKTLFHFPREQPVFKAKSRIGERLFSGTFAGLLLVMVLLSIFSEVPSQWRIVVPGLLDYKPIFKRALIMLPLSALFLEIVCFLFFKVQPLAVFGKSESGLRLIHLLFSSSFRVIFLFFGLVWLWTIFNIYLYLICTLFKLSSKREIFELTLGIGDPLAYLISYPLVGIFPWLFLICLNPFSLFAGYGWDSQFFVLAYKIFFFIFSLALLICLLKCFYSLKVALSLTKIKTTLLMIGYFIFTHIFICLAFITWLKLF